MCDSRMDTSDEKDLCLFWEWAQEYLGRSGQAGPLSTYGGLGQNLIGEHTIFGAVFQKGQHVSYYGVSHWSVARDQSGEIGPENVGIIHVFQWDCHLGW